VLSPEYRKAVDKFAPSLGRLYRSLRDATIRREPVPTQYGFSLAGQPSMVREDWEGDEKKTFLEILETHDTVLDIGANVGFYTCLAASRGKHTIAVEPLKRNLNFLYRNIFENHFTQVEVFPVGLAAKPGLAPIYGADEVSSFVPGWAHTNKAYFDLVPLSTLDTIAAGRFRNKKLLIKMDVEGFEMEVLAGAAETLDLSPKPTWLVEILLCNDAIPGGINRGFHEPFEAFWKHGYKCRMADGAGAVVTQADVSRWTAKGTATARNFIFS
jgi:FkbM family methyltransferase